MREKKKLLWHITIAKDDNQNPIYWQFEVKRIRNALTLLGVLGIALVMTLFGMGMRFYEQGNQLIDYQDEMLQKDEEIEGPKEEYEKLQKELQEALEQAQVVESMSNEQSLARGGPINEVPKLNMLEAFQIEGRPEEEDPYEPTYKPCEGVITSYYGHRQDPFNTSKDDYHNGIDIAASKGTPIYAAAKGVVTDARYMNGYGYAVFIDHGAGVETRYAHTSKLYVQQGQEVEKGEKIAAVGSTGNSTGPHLHFELRQNGQVKNPKKIFEEE